MRLPTAAPPTSIRDRCRSLTSTCARAKIRPMGENTEQYQRLRALFDEALRKDPSARQSYLEQACADDPALRPELQRLLDAHQKASSFLERPVELLPPPTLADDDFPGTERFTVLRRLGAGGMGVVYEVQDLARAEIVALKTLRHATPAGVYRLKQEFRSLAGVAHPNVVCLYELVVDDARCFFTMELVKGVNFVEYVRGGPRASLVDRSPDVRASTTGGWSLGAAPPGEAPSRYQAVQCAGDARGTRRDTRLRPDHGALP